MSHSLKISTYKHGIDYFDDKAENLKIKEIVEVIRHNKQWIQLVQSAVHD